MWFTMAPIRSRSLPVQGYGMIYQEITSGFSPGQTYSLWLYGRGDTNGDWKIDEPGDRIELYVKFVDAMGVERLMNR